jgi:hypothetical protein
VGGGGGGPREKIAPGYEHGLSYAERGLHESRARVGWGDNIIYTHATTNYISTYVYNGVWKKKGFSTLLTGSCVTLLNFSDHTGKYKYHVF